MQTSKNFNWSAKRTGTLKKKQKRIVNGLAIALGMAFLLIPSPSHADLVAHWTFDNDVSAVSTVGTITSSAVGGATIDTSDSKVGGGSLSLSGANSSSYVDITSAAGLNGLTNWTIAGFVKRASTSGIVSPLWATDVFTTGNIHVNIRDEVDGGSAPGTFQTAVSGTTALQNSDSRLIRPVTGETDWLHVATTWDGTTSRQYIDGIQVGTRGVNSTANFFGAGARIGSYANASERFWNGHIDDLRIYNEALDVAAIGQLSSIPEPSSAVLATFGLLGLAGRRRRRR